MNHNWNLECFIIILSMCVTVNGQLVFGKTVNYVTNVLNPTMIIRLRKHDKSK